MKDQENKRGKKISGVSVAVMLLIALALFGAFCFFNFAYQASKTSADEKSQPESQVTAAAE